MLSTPAKSPIRGAGLGTFHRSSRQSPQRPTPRSLGKLLCCNLASHCALAIRPSYYHAHSGALRPHTLLFPAMYAQQVSARCFALFTCLSALIPRLLGPSTPPVSSRTTVLPEISHWVISHKLGQTSVPRRCRRVPPACAQQAAPFA